MRRISDWLDAFPPGRVPLLLLVLTILAGGAILVRSVRTIPADIDVWTFTHLADASFARTIHNTSDWELARNVRSRKQWEQMKEENPALSLIRLSNLGSAMINRLSLGFMTGKELPNLVEVEQSQVGRYFRGPADAIPFVDLTDRLEAEGWFDKCVDARFAKYTVRGRTFGVPHDVHPCFILYCPDVLAELGYSPSQLQTWDDWKEFGSEVFREGEIGTSTWRIGLAMEKVRSSYFLLLLWQRGGDVFDAEGNVIIDSDLAVDTLEFYVSLFQTDTPAAGGLLSGWNEDFLALANGQIIGLIYPDYMLATMQAEAKTVLGGKVHIMPMPVWEPGGRRTSTMGGTMMGIPKGTENIERSWKMLKTLYFNKESLLESFRHSSIVPPLKDIWDDPVFHEENEFFGGQRVGELLTDLADEIPPVNGSPYTPEAISFLDAIFSDVIKGRIEPRAALEKVASDLRARMERDQHALQEAETMTKGGDQ